MYYNHKKDKVHKLLRIVTYFFNLVLIVWIGCVLYWVGMRSASYDAQAIYNKGVLDGKSVQLDQDEKLYNYCSKYKDMFAKL